MERSEERPFSVHPPESLRQSVRSLLTSANRHQAQENAKVSKVEICSQSRPDAQSPARAEGRYAQRLGVEPWNSRKMEGASRPKIGRDLVSRALLAIRNGARDNPRQQYRMDTCSSPFTVGYISVGRRHLVGSLQEVVELILKHRPDIHFLGILVTTCAHIGRLKKKLESALHVTQGRMVCCSEY